MNISDEIDASFGTGPEEGPVHALVTEGHRALRRRRLVSAGTGALVAVIVGGSAVYASGGGDTAGGPGPDVAVHPTATETATPFEPTRKQVNRALDLRLAEYDDSGRVVVDDRARVVQRITNPYDIAAPGKSVAFVLEFGRATYWFRMYRQADGSSHWASIWSGDADRSFEDWVAEVEVQPENTDPGPGPGPGSDEWPGIPDLDLVRFAGAGEVLEPVDGVTILQQRASPTVGDAFATAADRSAVALVRNGDGERFYVLARGVRGTSPQYIAVRAADGGPTLEAFLELARERYAPDGGGLL
jgi:hypothetical protein